MKRISFVTDIEGDMKYFQEFLSISSCVRWGLQKKSAHTMSFRNLQSNTSQAIEFIKDNNPTILAEISSESLHHDFHYYKPEECVHGERYSHLNHKDHLPLDLRRVGLEFTDDKSHFVYGGDAFDNGLDIGFAQACIDFKRRYPDRVHLILGNRDLNKIAMVPLIYDVEGMTAEEAERVVFPLEWTPGENISSRVSYAQFLCDLRLHSSVPKKQLHVIKEIQNAKSTAFTMANSTTFFQPNQSKPQRRGDRTHLRADRISFLKWALIYKMGSPDIFEHRRRELAFLKECETREKNDGQVRESFKPSQSMEDRNGTGVDFGKVKITITDDEVAESFFRAARPGGVYYEYIRLGVLATVLFDSILFVHGGVNGNNVGFVPNIRAITTEAQQREGCNFIDKGHNAIEWIRELNAFKDASFNEWSNNCGLRGEAARLYVFPRQYIPFSVTVGSIMQTNGPQYLDLNAAHYLLSSGIEIICTGHQPTGDTPALVRQPGGLLVLSADNSYCGRGNKYCTQYNQRGRAVMEVLIESKEYRNVENSPNGEKSSEMVTVRLHGRRADGTPFDFIANDSEELLLGRKLENDWWVKIPLNEQCEPRLCGGTNKDGKINANNDLDENSASLQASFYELHRTKDGFHSEEICIVSREKTERMLKKYHAMEFVPQSGNLKTRYTTKDLADTYTTRMKTKVKRSNITSNE
ncbi:unnamed protein product [Phytomonas sp. Hart1]|nr:unnamed protein product [Phytomonas sp. Hart1]|eukprot:CCW69053.1 unnamed protein product [Phytomonas sp. isolate Hart1]